MARGASGPALGTQFDEFLFASVRDDRNGPLSVLSALARLDIDPWQMAATLAKLPKAAAAQTLASLFADLPDGPVEREAVATQLVAFLPQQGASLAPASDVSNLLGREAHTPSTRLMLICALSILAILGVQSLIQSYQPSRKGPAASAAAVGKAIAAPTQVSAGR